MLFLLFTGQPPFQGLSRQDAHTLILQNHSRPGIPDRKRHSADFVDKTIVRAIDMCMKFNPNERATARQVVDFLSDAVETAKFGARSARFPSIEKRVKFYMSNWYIPPCEGFLNATTRYRFHEQDSTRQKVLVQDLRNTDMSNGVRVVEIEAHIGNDVTLVETGMLTDVNAPHAGYRADVFTSMLPLLDTSATEAPPILAQFGDRMSLHIASAPDVELFSVPYFSKCRPILAEGELERITRRQCYGREERLRPSSPFRPIPVHEPIIWKLDSNRLLGPLQNLTKVDIPWTKKKDKAIFRGALTGHAFHPSTRLRLQRHQVRTDQEYCQAIERCRFVFRNSNSSLVDARLTGLVGKPINPTIDGVLLLGEKMEMHELLLYKVVVILEGNDVSSGLRWALRSNSVVLMPTPTFTSWAMEELLQPWVHYIPLDPSFNDTESRIQWVLDHDAEAEKIAQQGSIWIKDLLEHPEAEHENVAINAAIFERYRKLFVRADNLDAPTRAAYQDSFTNSNDLAPAAHEYS